MSRLTLDGFKNFFKFYDGGTKQQEAIEELWKAMPVTLLEEEATWIDLYRTPDPTPKSSGTIPKEAIDLICEFEGFRANVYDDGLGIPTIGYGATYYPDGRKVQWGDPPISEPDAKRMMENMAEQDFWNVLEKTIPYWGEMTDGQKGALLSFSYNMGARFYGAPGCNTISNCLSDRAWSAVPEAFMLYVNPGTAVEAGLRRRREAEGNLWLS